MIEILSEKIQSPLLEGEFLASVFLGKVVLNTRLNAYDDNYREMVGVEDEERGEVSYEFWTARSTRAVRSCPLLGS
jgi:hypothetical protein